jgi:hypothetical protein
MPSSGIRSRVDLVKTDVSEKSVASILKVEEIYAGEEQCLIFLARVISSTLKMEVTRFSETSFL